MERDNTLTVLVVEDEPGVAKMLKMLLEQELEAGVDIALDCASAHELLSSNSYDLITLEYQLPDGDGLSLLEEILKMDGAPPVIMVTGHGDEHTAASAFMLGASGYVVKDKRLSTLLLDAVEHALSELKLRRAETNLGAALPERE